MKKLSDLPNIGKNTENQLNQVDIFSKEDLENIGAKEAWLKIQAIDPSACINRLMGLKGAILGIKKVNLPEEIKSDLRNFYNRNKLK